MLYLPPSTIGMLLIRRLLCTLHVPVHMSVLCVHTCGTTRKHITTHTFFILFSSFSFSGGVLPLHLHALHRRSRQQQLAQLSRRHSVCHLFHLYYLY